jgi:hypothetical protein
LVADTDFRIWQTLNCEVLSELSEGEICAVEFILPVAIGTDLVNEYGTVLAAVARQIPLRVTLNVQSSHHVRAVNGRLPNGRAHSLSTPGDLTRHTDIH